MRALETMKTCIHLDQDGTSFCEHHLSMARSIVHCDSIEHLENIRNKFILYFTRSFKQQVALAQNAVRIPWSALPLRVDPDCNTNVLACMRDGIYYVLCSC